MSASLPTESARDKAVNEFGLGTYDSSGESGGDHGEDTNEPDAPKGKSLPDGGGSTDPYGPDRLLSYPDEHPVLGAFLSKQDVLRMQDPSYREWFRQKMADIVRNPHSGTNWFPFGPSPSLLKFKAEMKGTVATGSMPGDTDAPTSHQHPDMETIEDPVMTVGESSELPDDADNPSARSDYYDKTVIGQNDELWPSEDSGAWAGEETADSELPGVNKNETTMDDFLGALGNFWSGYEIEDVMPPQGFPSTDLSENADFPKSNDGTSGGRLLATGNKDMYTPKSALEAFDRGELTIGGLIDTFTGRTAGRKLDEVLGTTRVATAIALVGELSEQFLKECGKKGLTKRHVLSFLQSKGQPQFLSSDIIRCLKHRHEVYVKDVLDEFPVAKQASSAQKTSVALVREKIVALEAEHVRNPEVSAVLRRAAAALTTAIVSMEKLEETNG